VLLWGHWEILKKCWYENKKKTVDTVVWYMWKKMSRKRHEKWEKKIVAWIEKKNEKKNI